MATNGITFTGMSSGIDTDSIVTALMQVESRPKTLLQQQQTVMNARRNALQDINTKLVNLKAAADALRSFTLYDGSPTATSADATKLTAAATTAAAAATYNIGI